MGNTYYEAPFQMKVMEQLKFPEYTMIAADYREAFGPNAIQQAVDDCAAAGGGNVVVDEGEWFTGPVHMKSNVHLIFEKGAVVTFSGRFADYLPVVFTRWEGMECYNYSPLIYACGCENIAVTGEGTLKGNGALWWHWKKLQQEAAQELCYAQSEGIPVEKRIYGTKKAALRPSFIQFVNCRDVVIEGITLVDGPQWTIHPVYCENVTVRNVTVNTSGPNTDGLNPDSCRNVLIEGCCFETGDDCIAINSGMNEDGWRVARPCVNILIRNCVMKGGHGGLVIGSGMSGGVLNLYAHDCEIRNTNQGIRLKSMRGRGGYVRDVWFERISLHNILEEAVQINMFYQYSTVEPKSEKPSDFAHIYIKDVRGAGRRTGVELCGLPEHPLRDIYLENIELECAKALICDNVEKMEMRNVLLRKPDRAIS